MATYTYLPWVRQGLGSAAKAATASGGRLGLDVSATITGGAEPGSPGNDLSAGLVAVTVALAAPRIRRWAALGLSGAAIVFTFYLLDGFMRGVAPSWSQKGPIAAYYENRRSPEERLIAYQLYWRGETFYTSNEIYEGPTEERTVFDQEGADDKLKDWMSRHRGRRAFFLYERHQQSRLQGMLPPESRSSFRVVDDQNNKFSLAQADL